MTEAEAIFLLMDAFPSVKVEECVAGTKDAVMVLAIKRQNAERGPERKIGGGVVKQIPCRLSELSSSHGVEASRAEAQHEAPEAQDGTQGFQFPEAV